MDGINIKHCIENNLKLKDVLKLGQDSLAFNYTNYAQEEEKQKTKELNKTYLNELNDLGIEVL